MNSKPRTTIDDIIFPGESRRYLDAQIACIDRMLAAIESHKSAAPVSTLLGNGTQKDICAQEDCTGALLTLTNGDEINVDLCNVGNWWTAKNTDHDGQCGQGATRDAALADLREICEEHAIRERDAQWRRILARAQMQGEIL